MGTTKQVAAWWNCCMEAYFTTQRSLVLTVSVTFCFTLDLFPYVAIPPNTTLLSLFRVSDSQLVLVFLDLCVLDVTELSLNFPCIADDPTILDQRLLEYTTDPKNAHRFPTKDDQEQSVSTCKFKLTPAILSSRSRTLHCVRRLRTACRHYVPHQNVLKNGQLSSACNRIAIAELS